MNGGSFVARPARPGDRFHQWECDWIPRVVWLGMIVTVGDPVGLSFSVLY